MIYYDTDVLVHSVVLQSEEAQEIATEYIRTSIGMGKFVISHLVLQEFAFVLAKIGVSSRIIQENLAYYANFAEFQISKPIFERAVSLASKVGFRNINDCLHTAIAEINCNELMTFNKSDFKKIDAMTSMKITYPS